MLSYLCQDGILCVFSDKCQEVFSNEDCFQLVESFFAYERPEQIHWVTSTEIGGDPGQELPMYHMSNGTYTVLLWPMLNKDGERVMAVQLREERQDIPEENFA